MVSKRPSGNSCTVASRAAKSYRVILEKIHDELLMLRANFCAQQSQEIARVGVGSRLERELGDQRSQCAVHRILADDLLQAVHRHRTLVVVDVALVLDAGEREFLHGLTAPRAQVTVEFGLQEFADLCLAVELLHDPQCGILREGLGEHGHALLVGADHLVRPPLVRDLVRGDVSDEIDLLVTVFIPEVLDETDALRVGHGVRERLREARVGGELEDPCLAELVGREALAEDREGGFHRIQHPLHVVIVRGMVIDRESHRLAAGPGPGVARLGIARRLQREEVLDGGLGAGDDGAPPVRGGIAHGHAGGHGRLVGIGAQADLRRHPVAVLAQVVMGIGAVVLQLRGTKLRWQSVLTALGAVLQEAFATHADHGRDLDIVDEAAVRDEARLRPAVREAFLLEPRHETEHTGLARLQGGSQAIDPEPELLVLPIEHCARHLDPLDLQFPRGLQQQLANRFRMAVLEGETALRHGEPLPRVDRHVEGHVGDGRLWRSFQGQELLLGLRLRRLALGRGDVAVQHIAVVVDERTASRPCQREQCHQRPGRTT